MHGWGNTNVAELGSNMESAEARLEMETWYFYM